MKSRAQALTEKSIAAMISAIEIYNKPDFSYREETFSILAINAWELLFKAKWLRDNDNKLKSLYVLERRQKSGGDFYKANKVKLTASGNPFTHGLDFLSKKLGAAGLLAASALSNIQALCEIRDSSVHFYNKSTIFAIRLQEVGSASVRNYALLVQRWFDIDLSKYNFYLMPLAFVQAERVVRGIVLGREEKNVAQYIASLEAMNDSDGDFAVSLNIELKFLRSKAEEALKVQYSKDIDATKVHLTEEDMKDRYPYNYDALTRACQRRYSDFQIARKYHEVRKPLKTDSKYCFIRRLDPDNPKSAKQEWYSQSIFGELDKHYKLRNDS